MTVLAIDPFDRANSTTLGSTPVGGFSWIEGHGDFSISSNRLVCTAVGASMALLDLGVVNQDVQFDCSPGGTTGQTLVVVRSTGNTDAGSLLAVGFQAAGTDLQLYKVLSGSYTLVGSYAAGVHGGTIRCIVIGDAVEVILNGTSRISYTITDAALRTGTKVGVYGGADVNSVWDNFSALDLTGVLSGTFGDAGLTWGSFVGWGGGVAVVPPPPLLVAYTLEVAFGTNPYVEPSAWIDISDYGRAFSIRRGRNHELGKTSAGVATITLDNRDRRFDPTNTGSPYYPNVRPMQHIRIRAIYNGVTTYDLFRGFVEDWGQQWSGPAANAQGDATCEVSCVDAFKLFEMAEFSSYSTAVLADSPIAYFPLDDPVGTQLVPNQGSADVFAITSPAGPGGIVFGRTSGAGVPAFDWQTSLDCQTPTGVGGGVPSQGLIVASVPDKSDTYNFGSFGRTTARQISVEAWLNTDTVAAGHAYWFDLEDLGLPGDPMLEIGRTASQIRVQWRGAGAVTTAKDSNFGYGIGNWLHQVVTLDSHSLRIYLQGILVQEWLDILAPVASYTPAPPLYLGVGSQSSDFTVKGWDGAIAHVAVYDYILDPGQIAAHYAKGLDGFRGETSGLVLNELLDRLAWPSGSRTISTGASTVTFAPDGSALDAFQQVAEDTEHGIFEMTPDGRVTFIARNSFTQASVATFGDGGGSEIPYRDLVLAYDDQDLWTEVDVSGATGSTSATDSGAVASYGQRNLGVTTVAATDAELTAQATGLLNRYKQPAMRPTSITFMGPRSITQQLTRAVGDRVTLKRRPPGGGTVTVDAIIEGVNHDVGPNGWLTTSFALAPPDPVTGTYWLLDDPVYSVLDTTTIPGW